MQIIETENYIYEVHNVKTKSNLYNVYVHKTSKLTGNYLGEATYKLQCDLCTLTEKDVISLFYVIY